MRKQHGFALLELMITAILATLLAVWASNTLVNRISDASAQAHAAWMLVLQKSVHDYIQAHAGVLMHADHVAAMGQQGYADWAAPTLPELKAGGLLSSGFPESAFPGGGASVRLIRHGECPGPTCRVEALVYGNKPFLHAASLQVNEQMVAQWLMAAQGWGGSVTRHRPDRVSGAAFDIPNPPVAGSVLPPGTVALAITSGQLGLLDFLRVGDTRDPSFAGNATVRGNISTQGNLQAGQYLHLGAQAMLDGSCPDDTAVARDVKGGLLICQDGFWRSASRTGGGGFSMNMLYGCTTRAGAPTVNPVTGACSCPSTSTAVLISDSGPQAFPEGRTLGFLCVD
ncbi:prepilin-type N-terminal cleavage/methylation domain-containing protein [Alcaligenaceae bacterium]|nr:prepilin-type N-terminal cleavage/methylation domain-containing protein [Alcaligenaceae bacterium]